MKRISAVFYAVLIAAVLAACDPWKETSGLTLEQIWQEMGNYLADGAAVSDERPLPDIASEQEVLVHAAQVALSGGYLNPAYHFYQEDPRLLSTKIEVPILIYDFSGEPAMTGYILIAVATNGQCLLEKYVRADADIDDKTFFGGAMPAPGLSYGNDDFSYHRITEQEARSLIESQFPGETYEGPIAARLNLEKFHIFSPACVFWYFTTGGSEYIIDSRINEYNLMTIKLTPCSSV